MLGQFSFMKVVHPGNGSSLGCDDGSRPPSGSIGRADYALLVAKEVDIRGDSARAFPEIDDPLSITHAGVFGCRYQDWDALSRLTNLVSLNIANFEGEDFEALRPLRKIEQLRVFHLPKVTNIDPLAELVSLRRLIFETIPGWDASGKVTQLDSLEPLRGLPLEEVQMFGVRPASKAVDDLLAISTLRQARLSKFAAKEIKRIGAVISDDYVNWQTPEWSAGADPESGSSGVTFRTP
jgi:hypothetical protein